VTSEDRPAWDEAEALLRGAAAKERDANWQGYLHYLLGEALLAQGKRPEALRCFLQAKQAFDPFQSNFKDVATAYVSTLSVLINTVFSERDEIDQIASCAFDILCNLESSELDTFETALVFGWLGSALNRLGREADHSFLHRLALAAYLRAHHLSPEDPNYLLGLMHTYSNLSEPTKVQMLNSLLRRVSTESNILNEGEDLVARLNPDTE